MLKPTPQALDLLGLSGTVTADCGTLTMQLHLGTQFHGCHAPGLSDTVGLDPDTFSDVSFSTLKTVLVSMVKFIVNVIVLGIT